MTLAAPKALWLLLLLATAFGLRWLAGRRRSPAVRVPLFGAARLERGAWAHLAWLPDAVRFSALAIIAVALARPQLPEAPALSEELGIDIVLALDTSCSMLAADFQPADRMNVAKKSISEFIEKRRPSDRIGLVLFAGEAVTWVPPTTDHRYVTDLLDDARVGALPRGTSIGDAIAVSLNRLRKSDAASRVVVLITDGDNNAGTISPSEATDLAANLGVQVHTILIGEGGLVPFPAGKDIFGRTIYKRRRIPTNPRLLKQIADSTHGGSYTATSQSELDLRLNAVLNELDETARATALPASATELFMPLLFAALVLMALERVLRSLKLTRFP